MIRFFLLLALIMIGQTLVGQESPYDFGDIPLSQFKLTSPPDDPEADAIMLLDYGSVNVISQGRIIYKYHQRIKILKEAGLELADQDISAYIYNDSEEIEAVQAQTINWENGKEKKYKVAKKSYFTEKEGEYYERKKWSFPNVKVGSILEFSYEVEASDVYALKNWYFQTGMPVLESIYQAKLPNGFDYTFFLQGMEKEEGFSRKKNNSSSLFTWKYTDIPPFESDDFMPPRSDFAGKLQFQLRRFKNYYDWEDILAGFDDLHELLEEHQGFGEYIDDAKEYATDSKGLRVEGESVYETIQFVFDAVSEKISWDDELRIFAKDPVRDVWKQGQGSSAEINLFLVGAFRKNGLKSYPVILSTRGNGTVNEEDPMLRQFNNVMAAVITEQDTFYVDGTADKRSFELIPFGNLGRRGLLLSGKSDIDWDDQWVNIEARKGRKHECQAKMTIEDGELVGELRFIDDEYSAIDGRELLEEMDEEEYVESQVSSPLDGAEIDDFTFTNVSDIHAPFELSVDFIAQKYLEDLNEFYYLKPMLFEAWRESPFSSDKERQYPVDFYYPRTEKYNLEFTVPVGYKVEELPSSQSLDLGEDAVFEYTITQEGNLIKLDVLLDIKRVLFDSDEYAPLKEFIDLAVIKQNEQIILKRAN